ncbi:MAG: hypothetical protein Tp1124DCM412911_40 [Prokaryotic dsDNA virus sp.]|nr:MAG: hypothetical protein Tp1124DCM412911_40 [Prokaryotic dsDNA virus sp.]
MIAKRVDHTEARMPAPSQALIKACAKAGYLAMATSMDTAFDYDFTDWDDLKRSYREVWEQVARALYAVIAIQGGAIVEEIPNVQKPDEEE